MKTLIAGIIALFVGIMVIVWVASEKAHPVFLPQPADFQTWTPHRT